MNETQISLGEGVWGGGGGGGEIVTRHCKLRDGWE